MQPRSPRFGVFYNLLTRIRAENVIFTHVFRTDPEISVDFARAVDKQMPHLPQRLRHIALYAVDLAFGQKGVRRPDGTSQARTNSAIVSSLLVAVSSHLIILCLLCHRSLPRSLLQAFGRPLCSHPRAISSTRCTASRHRDREDIGFYRCCRARNSVRVSC